MTEYLVVCMITLPFHPLQVQHTGLPLLMAPGAVTSSMAGERHGKRRTMTTGMPISLRSFWHSSLCSRVTRTVRLVNLSTSSAVPVSFASSPSAFASSLLSKRFASYTCTHFNDRRYSELLSLLTTPDFNSGGRPSNTYAGLIPFSTIRIVL